MFLLNAKQTLMCVKLIDSFFSAFFKVDMLMHIINGSAGKKDDVISKETLINFAKQGMYGTDRSKDEL